MRSMRGIIVFTVVLCTGCGTLFNKQRSDTATAAQKKFTDVKLADLLKEERKRSGEILAREIEIAQRQMTAARDARLIAIATTADVTKSLGKAIDERTKTLRNEDTQISRLLVQIADGEEGVRFARDLYLVRRRVSDPKAECSGQSGTVSDRARDDWDDYQDRCSELAGLRTQLATHTKAGLLGETALRIASTERARNDLAVQLKSTEDEARKAAKELADIQVKAKKTPLDIAKLKQLKAKLSGLEIPASDQVIDDVRVAAALRWAEMQKAAVDKILAAATSGATEPPPGTSDALQIVAVLPSLAAQLNEGFRYPRVSALVMESQRLRIEANRYQRQLARVDEELTLLRAKLVRLRLENSLLVDATSKLREGDVEGALARYAEAWTASRIPLKETEWKLIGLSHDRALDQSEAAIAQWEALVRTPLEALVASAGSGLTSDEIAGLLHAIELGALGVGVF